MKLYQTKSQSEDSETAVVAMHFELTSSATDASKVRTRLKKLGHEKISTDEVELDTTRAGVIKYFNSLMADPSWVVEPVAKAVVG